MKREDKELLLKDLSARVSYKPIVQIDDCGIWNLRGIDHDNSAKLRDRVIVWHGESYPSSKNTFPIINCKPYLFPMSSMTEEQRREFKSEFVTYHPYVTGGWYNIEFVNRFYAPIEIIDWLNKNHFDYRGLIQKGLAIDATGLGIY